MQEPQTKRLHVFFDCQNLFHACRKAWDYDCPNFDPLKLSRFLSKMHPDWTLKKVHVYTGIHDSKVNPRLHSFWTNKLALLNQSPQVEIITRPLRYTSCDGIKVAREKGIDVRIALDLVRLARTNEFDVAALFSQDNDFREVSDEIRAIAREFDRWIKIASAFPGVPNAKGIDRTDWIPVPKEDYDRCIDPNDYSAP
ncbi:NYN domain-containing protein [Aminithiophilus ramosus]|uniref:NYN domain-containing protein n=1 Tax=Aminithiophilus ramosus TaxID=3029084 RepID=UPI0023681CE1|nr:NYN domain-containing protein [Aminithiophilus ramosus]